MHRDSQIDSVLVGGSKGVENKLTDHREGKREERRARLLTREGKRSRA